jgi:glucose/arabinose dehydrogenase
MTTRWVAWAIAATFLAACGDKGAPEPGAAAQDARAARGEPFVATEIAKFNEPWAMTFLPDGRLLVTERQGTLQLYTIGGTRQEVSGVPAVAYGGQGGLGDVVAHPKFAENRWIYLSYAEAGDGELRGAAVARAKLEEGEGGPQLAELTVIWRQEPKVTGMGHYGHRLLFDADGYLWISSGERQKFDPAQDMNSNLGKIVRLNDDGSVPADNPFAEQGGVTAQIWSLGHRNPLGLAFDAEGRLWNHEMGPEGGDELNLVKRGANYGYPVVSEGNHYGGAEIPSHLTHQEFTPPAVTWVPVISPAGFVIYSGNEFPDWRGDGFIGGLSSEALIRVEFDGERAREAARYPMGARIREVEQGPDGALWVLEDERDGKGGRLLKLTSGS